MGTSTALRDRGGRDRLGPAGGGPAGGPRPRHAVVLVDVAARRARPWPWLHGPRLRPARLRGLGQAPGQDVSLAAQGNDWLPCSTTGLSSGPPSSLMTSAVPRRCARTCCTAAGGGPRPGRRGRARPVGLTVLPAGPRARRGLRAAACGDARGVCGPTSRPPGPPPTTTSKRARRAVAGLAASRPSIARSLRATSATPMRSSRSTARSARRRSSSGAKPIPGSRRARP